MDSLASKQAAVPPFSLLEMPEQGLDRFKRKRRPLRPRLATLEEVNVRPVSLHLQDGNQ